MPNVLLVYPELPPSYWSAKYALKFVGKKAAHPPLGLLTIGALFPESYNLRLVDMNVGPLTGEDLEWCDYVFCSAMIVQKDSFNTVLRVCNEKGIKFIGGGPYVTSFYEEISGADHLVLGEVEAFFGEFLAELETGRAPSIYRAPTAAASRPSMESSRAPKYDLIRPRDYASMALQFSRGCPYDCEFCDITKLYGRTPRVKSIRQVLGELDILYNLNWRGTVFFVDDNFIGNRAASRKLLPEIAKWQKKRGYPFSFYTEASVNLADMPDLLDDMADAGFDMVFLGIETPNPEALLQANKGHNVKAGNADHLLHAVHTIQKHGLEVSGGFILGLDGDNELSFDAQIDFIQKAGIPTAMVGLLTAIKGTDLYERYKAESRLIDETSGNNMSATLNYMPLINKDVLLTGYKRVLKTLYDPGLRNYFKRCEVLLKNWGRRPHCTRRVGKDELLALCRSLYRQLLSRQAPAYASFVLKTLLCRPGMFAQAIRFAILGYHYERTTRQQIVVDEFKAFLEIERKKLVEKITYYRSRGAEHSAEARAYITERVEAIQGRLRSINSDFQGVVEEALESFQRSIREHSIYLSDHLSEFFDLTRIENPL